MSTVVLLIALLAGFVAAPVAAQDSGAPLRLWYPERYETVTRYNLRRYEDNRYSGLSFREVRGVMRRIGASIEYEGRYYVLEETLRDMRQAARRVDQSYTAWIDFDDPVPQESDADSEAAAEPERSERRSSFPLYRGIPAIPQRALSVGESWEARGEVVIDPLWQGRFTHVPVYVRYRFEGSEVYQGRSVLRIHGRYAVRYSGGLDQAGDPELAAVSGSHELTILLDAASGELVLLRDIIEQQHRYHNGPAIAFRGFSLTWNSRSAPLDTQHIDARMRRTLEQERIAVSESSAGLTLTLSDILFVADQAAMLPGQGKTLDALARALQSVADASLLVVGHTADVGLAENQYRLSVERAETVIGELVSRGIAAQRFIYEGRGGSEPVADNTTAEGRAQNRRVEITILE